MKLYFGLGWIKSNKDWRRSFKSHGAEDLLSDYLERLSHFAQVSVGALPNPDEIKNEHVWLCDFSKDAKQLSSEALAEKVKSIQNQSFKKWYVLIGGADGFDPGWSSQVKINFKWSFGLMTLPHELAAVVASEQIYRAWTILHHLPYHSGH